ncbi:hypothetical protein THAOC_26552, partial [Thalassiosira oceanica]
PARSPARTCPRTQAHGSRPLRGDRPSEVVRDDPIPPPLAGAGPRAVQRQRSPRDAVLNGLRRRADADVRAICCTPGGGGEEAQDKTTATSGRSGCRAAAGGNGWTGRGRGRSSGTSPPRRASSATSRGTGRPTPWPWTGTACSPGAR